MRTETLSDSPRVLRLHGFLSSADVAQLNALIDRTYPHDFLPSAATSSTRTSHSLRIGLHTLPVRARQQVRKQMRALMRDHYDTTRTYTDTQDPYVIHAERTGGGRLPAFRQTLPTCAHLEPPKLSVYASSERFGEHRDSVHPNASHRDHARGGSLPYADGVYANRVLTMLVYLNTLDATDGGATVFPRLGLRVQPIAGTCLVFFPCTGHVPTPDDRTLHYAEAVGDHAQKRVWQQWVWSAPYEAARDTGSRDIVHGLQWVARHTFKRSSRPVRTRRQAAHHTAAHVLDIVPTYRAHLVTPLYNGVDACGVPLRIYRVRGFLGAHDCAQLRDLLHHTPRTVRTSASSRGTSYRNSVERRLRAHRSHPSVKRLQDNVRALLGVSLAQMEAPKVTYYPKGAFFKNHVDPVRRPNGNTHNRVATVLVYLNTVARGGATAFSTLPAQTGGAVPPVGAACAVRWQNEGDYRATVTAVHGDRVDVTFDDGERRTGVSLHDVRYPVHDVLRVPPVRGDALVFFPAYLPDSPHAHRHAKNCVRELVHEALPAGGEKYVCQQWVWSARGQMGAEKGWAK